MDIASLNKVQLKVLINHYEAYINSKNRREKGPGCERIWLDITDISSMQQRAQEFEDHLNAVITGDNEFNEKISAENTGRVTKMFLEDVRETDYEDYKQRSFSESYR